MDTSFKLFLKNYFKKFILNNDIGENVFPNITFFTALNLQVLLQRVLVYSWGYSLIYTLSVNTISLACGLYHDHTNHISYIFSFLWSKVSFEDRSNALINPIRLVFEFWSSILLAAQVKISSLNFTKSGFSFSMKLPLNKKN